jgi:hypothetical protein
MSQASSPNITTTVIAPTAIPTFSPVVSPEELPLLETEVWVDVHAATLPLLTEEK